MDSRIPAWRFTPQLRRSAQLLLEELLVTSEHITLVHPDALPFLVAHAGTRSEREATRWYELARPGPPFITKAKPPPSKQEHGGLRLTGVEYGGRLWWTWRPDDRWQMSGVLPNPHDWSELTVQLRAVRPKVLRVLRAVMSDPPS